MRIYLVITLIFVSAHSIKANIYFVATNGNDANTGSEAQPWASIQKAANTLTAGDTVFVKAGEYNERVIIQNSGTANNYIVFSSYQNDEVTINGNGISWGSAWNGLFDVSNKDYIQITGFKIINADYAGIWAENANHLLISNNYTYNTFSSGIGVWNSSYVSIENNEVELACNDGEQECITIANSNNCNIFNNDVHHNGPGTEGGEGIDVKAGSHDINVYKNEVHHLNNRLGIYADAWDLHTYNINIYQNVIHHCSETGLAVASENGGLIENVVIFNNVIYLNQYGGIELGSWSDIGFAGKKPIERIKIINNTCVKNGGYNNGWGYGVVIDNPDAKDILIRNNICSENSAQIAVEQIANQAIIDHNLFFGNNIAAGTLYGSDSIIGNPLFRDASAYDFHLLDNSPAIDNGSSVDAPTVDFDNANRPYGGGVDIGAYEYNTLLNVKVNKDFGNFVNIYPNPVFDKLLIAIDNDTYQNYTLQLVDAYGKLVRNVRTNKVKKEVVIMEREGINSGLYILTISADDKVRVSKTIIIE